MTNRIYLFVLISFCSVWAFFFQKYEPQDGRVLHGLGQFVNLTFYSEEENWQLVSDYQNSTGFIPTIYSAYAYIDPYVDDLDSTDITDIVSNHGYPYVLLLGISLFDSTSSLSDVNIPVQSILDGELDYQIIKIAQEIKSLTQTPVFLRPGFEFGSGNSGLHNDPDNPNWTAANFNQIWIHIHDIFSQQEVTNVAWVWNTVNPQSFDFIDWYPGDEYVDWWGINYFTANQIASADPFLNSAFVHNKPVMICESNPIENSGTTNESNWNNWFVPYFNKMNNNSHIKAFVYIDDPWDKSGFFDSWPDSRITSNQTILENYITELESSTYIHMDEYQSNPGLIDSPLPVNISLFITNSLPDVNLIEWRTESEINNLGFNLYRADSKENIGVEKLNFYKLNTSLISGAGSSSAQHDYLFRDYQVKNKWYYWYQLEQLDYNGKSNKLEIKKLYRDIRVPKEIQIFQNYPNPFNSETNMNFNLPEKSDVRLSIYSVTGAFVETVVNCEMSKGYHTIYYDASKLASGIYLYQLNSEHYNEVRKMILIK